MESVKKDIEYFVKNIWYIIPVILVAILSFGFVLTHYSINIDTLSADRYFREGELLAQSRFGMVLVDKIFNVMDFNPFFVDTLAVIFLIISTITFCIIFRKITNDKLNMVVYTIFSCVFISYPLINEIFVFTPAGLTICVCFFGIAICINYVDKYLKENKVKYLIYISILLTLIIASYESFASVYLCGIFIVFILDCIYNFKELKFKETVKKIIELLLPLIIAILLVQIISTVLMVIYKLTPSKNAAKYILYFTKGIWKTLKILVHSVEFAYIIRGLVYLPITVLVIAIIINFIMSVYYSKKRKSIMLFLLFVGTGVTLIALSIIQGDASAYRTCQVFPLFIAFTFMLFTQSILNSNISKLLKNFVIILMFILVFYQAKDLHKWFYLNYLRYESEKIAITNIANDIQKGHDTNKPIVFWGYYYLPKYIEDNLYKDKTDIRYRIYESIADEYIKKEYIDEDSKKVPVSNVNSYLRWGISAFLEPNTEIFKWLEMLGYDFKQGDTKMLIEAVACYINNMPSYPNENYILETDDFIIVRLQESR